MSHFPYMLRAAMGIGPPKAPHRRNENLSSDTPATFGEGLNWNYCENGSPNPVTSPGVTSYMGPPSSERAGKGVKWPDASASILVFVAEQLRSCAGISVKIIPDDDERDDANKQKGADGDHSCKRRKTEDKKTPKEQEMAYIKGDDWNYDEIEVFDKNRKLVASYTTMSLDNPWLCFTCLDAETSKLVLDLMKDDFDLAEFPHVKQELEIEKKAMDAIDAPGEYRLESLTGSSPEDTNKSSVTTLFFLYLKSRESSRDDDKVVAKALCSYQNSEMNSVGPTLEVIETAKEWRRHGLGGTLMRGMNSFYCERFGAFESRVLFSVCHVTNYQAGRWFLRRHRFLDLDGMGEELGKYLNADDYEYDNDEDEDASEADY